MVTLQYFNGKEWQPVGDFISNHVAWLSIGQDYDNYRTVDSEGNEIMRR
tara:strand:- start:36603 stop:36749 length:147 start_codon:yes stop_codon:yes gene_type:complete